MSVPLTLPGQWIDHGAPGQFTGAVGLSLRSALTGAKP